MGISLMFTENVDALGIMANKATIQMDMNHVLIYSQAYLHRNMRILAHHSFDDCIHLCILLGTWRTHTGQ